MCGDAKEVLEECASYGFATLILGLDGTPYIDSAAAPIATTEPAMQCDIHSSLASHTLNRTWILPPQNNRIPIIEQIPFLKKGNPGQTFLVSFIRYVKWVVETATTDPVMIIFGMQPLISF